jgi:transcriptional regulator with XRE-family HTH domain
MTDTHNPTSQVVSTRREREARFALQMAEQARKFGARVAELRDEKRWKQRDLVAAMAALGDQSLNTNQLSRYENGGAMPGEQRQSWFAEALETTVGDLHAGPLEERGAPEPTPDVLGALSAGVPPELQAQLDRIEETLVELRTDVAGLGVQLEKSRAPAPRRQRPKPAAGK